MGGGPRVDQPPAFGSIHLHRAQRGPLAVGGHRHYEPRRAGSAGGPHPGAGPGCGAKGGQATLETQGRREEGSGKEGRREEGSGKEGRREEGSGKEGRREEGSGKEGRREEGSGKEGRNGPQVQRLRSSGSGAGLMPRSPMRPGYRAPTAGRWWRHCHGDPERGFPNGIGKLTDPVKRRFPAGRPARSVKPESELFLWSFPNQKLGTVGVPKHPGVLPTLDASNCELILKVCCR